MPVTRNAKGTRVQSAYGHFVKDNLKEVKQENPNATNDDIARALTAKWKSLSREEKEPYERSARVDRHKHESEKNYGATKGEEEDEED
ncbi:non-histone chromosomal protein 6 [Mytilinidion resinicola]|uniref:Non-histone chromosomal protein 6 n=1 Tax=Mytilinidion resinicola TaxID=574789 RepID=A0A6A6Z2M7_9PEZI|nr:non-histone chromosomal protein 6 [Mytilinidion resinicola]KAF2815068.1 non-histone chromosomal protein 6 [Mytilinidion resinicola]